MTDGIGQDADGALLARLRVLFVEDDPEARQRLGLLLRLWVGTVIAAEDGAAGLALYREHRPDLVITDIQMPNMNGLEMTRELRKLDPELPIIVTTAFNDQDYFLQAIDLGIDSYVIKPIDTTRLREVMAKAARADAQRRQARDELEITRYLIERMMLSERMRDPQLRYYSRATRDFNGDMIAALRGRNRDLYVLVADATGHGLPAAINLLPLVRIFYTMAEKGFSVSVIAEEMNETLREQSTADRFVAATLVRVNNAAHTIEVWNGGNPEALLVDHAGAVVHEFRSTHLPLGIVGRSSFCHDTDVTQWQADCQLYLCSDGFLDGEGPGGERFGSERLRQSLCEHGPEERFAALVQALQLHLGAAGAHDDVSLLAVECPYPGTPA